MKLDVKVGGDYHPVALLRPGSPAWLRIGGVDVEVALHPMGGGRYEVALAGHTHPVWIAASGERVFVHAFGRPWELELVDPIERAAEEEGSGDHVIRAPMPGLVVEVQAAAGQRVSKGQPLMTIESMKLETVIQASRDGELAAVHQCVGAAFDRGAPLVSFVQGE